MKYLSRKNKKITFRKSRVFRKKNRKTIAKKRIYKKRNTRKRRRFGGMETDDIESGKNSPLPLFINPKEFRSTMPVMKPPTPTNDPSFSSWKGLKRTNRKIGELTKDKEPPLTDSGEGRALLNAYYPLSYDVDITPRSSISSDSNEIPKNNDNKIVDLFEDLSPKDRQLMSNVLNNDSSSDEESEDEEIRKANTIMRLKKTMKEFGVK